MNLLLLVVGLRAWGRPPVAVITRVFYAVSLLSLEMQFATWTGWATLRSLVIANFVGACVALWTTRRQDAKQHPFSDDTLVRRYALSAALAVGAVVFVVNVTLPPTSVDPYHIERLAHIERSGTVAHDRSIGFEDPRVNVLGWLYELVLADLKQVPGI